MSSSNLFSSQSEPIAVYIKNPGMYLNISFEKYHTSMFGKPFDYSNDDAEIYRHAELIVTLIDPRYVNYAVEFVDFVKYCFYSGRRDLSKVKADRIWYMLSSLFPTCSTCKEVVNDFSKKVHSKFRNNEYIRQYLILYFTEYLFFVAERKSGKPFSESYGKARVDFIDYHFQIPQTIKSQMSVRQPQASPTLVHRCQAPQASPTLVHRCQAPQASPTLVHRYQVPQASPTLVNRCQVPQASPTLVNRCQVPQASPTLVNRCQHHEQVQRLQEQIPRVYQGHGQFLSQQVPRIQIRREQIPSQQVPRVNQEQTTRVNQEQVPRVNQEENELKSLHERLDKIDEFISILVNLEAQIKELPDKYENIIKSETEAETNIDNEKTSDKEFEEYEFDSPSEDVEELNV